MSKRKVGRRSLIWKRARQGVLKLITAAYILVRNDYKQKTT
ncbi:MAG: hypothetical protein AB8U88_04860 [Rickettsia conorii subsp. raoultii]|nr:hypothetical protein [Rickettsia conorii]